MTGTLADRTISQLRAIHDELVSLVSGLSSDQLVGPSGAAEWSVAQVLSHLGSGSEIMLEGLNVVLTGAPPTPDGFHQSVWDRWNAMTPQAQATGFQEHDARLIATLEALTPAQRAELAMDVPFLPYPLPVATLAGMRLSEAAQHGWDVRVAFDTGAALSVESADLLAEQLAGGLSFLLGFTGKADALTERTAVDIAGSAFGLVIEDTVSMSTDQTDATATFSGPLEAAIRLIGGRLKEQYTPAGTAVTGNVTLEDLRRVFPGF